MTKIPAVKNRQKERDHTNVYLVACGLVFTFGWAMLLGITNWVAELPYVLSPDNGEDGRQLAQILLYAPAVVGSVLLVIGALRPTKLSLVVKIVIGAIVSSALLFVCFWLMIFVGIATYGFGG